MTYCWPSNSRCSLPSATIVPTPVRVKNAGMPAPPARSLSASVPCGVNSSSSSPARYWRSNSLFSPTYEAIILRICRVVSNWPKPKPSTPALLLMQVRFLTPESRSAAIRASGMPHRPKPPTAIIWPSSTTPASASSALAYTLSICPAPGNRDSWKARLRGVARQLVFLFGPILTACARRGAARAQLLQHAGRPGLRAIGFVVHPDQHRAAAGIGAAIVVRFFKHHYGFEAGTADTRDTTSDAHRTGVGKGLQEDARRTSQYEPVPRRRLPVAAAQHLDTGLFHHAEVHRVVHVIEGIGVAPAHGHVGLVDIADFENAGGFVIPGQGRLLSVGGAPGREAAGCNTIDDITSLHQ